MKTDRLPLLTVDLRQEPDVVTARKRARQLASIVGLGAQDQTRFATATSEITRNAVRYAGGGKCEFLLAEQPAALWVRVTDRGAGIGNLEEVLAGRYTSATGMGLGLAGTRRLMDHFSIESGRSGTTVQFAKELPRAAPLLRPSRVVEELARMAPVEVEEDLRQTDHELLRAIAELRARNEELEQIRGELEETNRGVVALYAELDEKAESLRRATELKSRFLSNMSHEFRTPLNSVHSLARILLDGSEGPLAGGQRRAVSLIQKAAMDLAEMVNDVLDLAKIEAGKIVVRPAEFEVAKLLGSLRGVIKPLVNEASGVQLVVEDAEPSLPPLFSDEGKLQQILRNFASNALKFTERGEVRVGARQDEPGTITFFVKDTGIGIAAEDQQRIFEEFTQVEGPVQKRVKGTGLGLPLSKKLAELLGGSIALQSAPGEGSTFSVQIPLRYAAKQEPAQGRVVLGACSDEEALLRWEKFLAGTSYHLAPARTLDEAREELRKARPAVVLAGAFLGGQSTRPLLADLRKDPATRDVPIVGIANVEHEHRALSLAADFIVGKLDERHELLEALARALAPPRRVLVIANERVPRDELRSLLSEPRVELLEARDAAEGVRRAREERPRAVVLDAGEPGFAAQMAGMLRADPATRGMPILVRAAGPLGREEAEQLSSAGVKVVSVASLMREEAARRLREAVWQAGGAHA